ncbi:MAG: glutamate--tRNA ligase [Acidimicrobiales bacterium]|jgi:glutamyl-tRNA synthetase|nr:glutamate--tRNA ligase [Acidimicrobiaceae bacterium]MDP6162664.1 glutamate--tRNA ligase [Acidimicrobiales bacterium]MDP6285363.1 glutamate--tRNA ligase [Acidimicrobiales bacterium]HJL91190.1 glutamate--tRNA ligase [Acidimicrobiales bacterium]HJO41648.1 glutamate--tRNA ligase [Acidimicrobiales bacterium]
MKPRVRFAPSPTGFLHVGSARTALFNWLYARATGGTYILRVEDTDQERNRPELTQQLLGELEWLGLDWDEGPVFQSEKLERHREVVQTFLEDGHAYLCDNENREVEGSVLAEGLAVRFRMPQGKTISFNDLVRGEVAFNTDDLEDFVIWRSNGTPMFLLANAVDDADMGITHAIRGEDLLSGVPKVLLLLDAMGVEHPTYAHLPLLVNEQRKKLSKRRDDVAVGDYREKGFLPEAMVNYLALLGWGPPDGVEIRSLSEIVKIFNIEDVNKAAAFFDIQKFEHINSSYLRDLSKEDFMNRVEPWIGGKAPWPEENFDPEKFSVMADLIQEKLRTLSDTPRFVDFLFLEEPDVDEDSWKKTMKDPQVADSLLGHIADSFEECEWETDVLKDLVTKAGEKVDLKLGKAQAPLRVAVTGRTVGPPLFETMSCCMTREEVLKRISDARKSL